MKTTHAQLFRLIAVIGLSVSLSACRSGESAAADGGAKAGGCPRCEMRLVRTPPLVGGKVESVERQMHCSDCGMTRKDSRGYNPDDLCVCCGGTLANTCDAD